MINMNRRYKQKETKNQNYHDSIAKQKNLKMVRKILNQSKEEKRMSANVESMFYVIV